MFAASVFLAFLLTTQASRIPTLLSLSEPLKKNAGTVSKLRSRIQNPVPPKSSSRFEIGSYPLGYFQSSINGNGLFPERSCSNQPVSMSSVDAGLPSKATDTPSSSRSNPEESYRAKVVEREHWFPSSRYNASKHKEHSFTDGIIQRVVGFGQFFQCHNYGLTTATSQFGSLIKRNRMIFSEQLKCGLVAKGMEALKDQGFFGSERLLKVEKSANNTLAVVLAGKRIVFHSFGTPALAAVLLRVKEDRYESIMISEDNMSVEGTLKSKDIIVVGVCHVIWGGPSFPADSSLESIVTGIAERLSYGMAVAAIIR
ncbi:hypothetical protein PSACC_00583 [Paramicrosporidium saccamoebae]|uniref:Uncharacterized protein n=1 Tax=Paramicrosporidium saccamoebae TaxID=1246581 RepID=A0A2H9TPB1_9FUNG|nr:hypothetical protein PSACC_00583 [Paramicrosporidium saccamoebae]